MFRALTLTALLVITLAPEPRAECVKTPLKDFLKRPENQLVFSGTVVALTQAGGSGGSRATFEVDRVWKGRAPARVDVYMGYHGGSAETPRYEKDRRYGVVARRLTDAQARASLDVKNPEAIVFVGATCTGLYTVEEFERALGRGKPPAKRPENKR